MSSIAVGAEGQAAPATRGRWAKGWPYLLYAIRRIVQAVIVILLAYVITFVVIEIVGANPISTQLHSPQAGLSPGSIQKLETYYGVNKPPLEQLWLGLSRFVRGDLGISLQYHLPVKTLITTALPYTLKLAGMALLISFVIAALIAYGSQHFPLRGGREMLRSLPSLFLSVPNFVVGILLIELISFRWHLFDVLDPDSFVATLCAAFALALPICAPLCEVLIANLDNESAQEYVLVARSRGLSEAKIFFRHLVKPASLPTVTMAALVVGELMGGALIVEEVFGRTGVGTLMYHSVSSGDTPVLQAVVALAAVVFVTVNLIADLIAPLLDPRVELVGPRAAGGLVRGLGRGFQPGNKLGSRA